MSATPRLAFSFLAAGQAQKETTVNESLQRLDFLVQAAVEEGPRASPPASPTLGQCFIVASGATGDWTGRSGQIAAFTEGGWRYAAPTDGMQAFVKTTDVVATYHDGVWDLGTVRGSKLVVDGNQVVGARGAAIAAPTGGGTVDAECRTAVGSILAALRSHGLIAP